jgi:hypothetical protein
MNRNEVSFGHEVRARVWENLLGERHPGRQAPRDCPVPLDEIGDVGGGVAPDELEQSPAGVRTEDPVSACGLLLHEWIVPPGRVFSDAFFQDCRTLRTYLAPPWTTAMRRSISTQSKT